MRNIELANLSDCGSNKPITMSRSSSCFAVVCRGAGRALSFFPSLQCLRLPLFLHHRIPIMSTLSNIIFKGTGTHNITAAQRSSTTPAAPCRAVFLACAGDARRRAVKRWRQTASRMGRAAAVISRRKPNDLLSSTAPRTPPPLRRRPTALPLHRTVLALLFAAGMEVRNGSGAHIAICAHSLLRAHRCAPPCCCCCCCVDAFDEGDGEQVLVKDGAKGNYVHIRIQQRNGRKSLTTVQGLATDLDLKKILKALKKTYSTNGTILVDEELGEIIQLQGQANNNNAGNGQRDQDGTEDYSRDVHKSRSFAPPCSSRRTMPQIAPPSMP